MKKAFIGVVSAFLFCQTACEVEDYNLSDISTDDLVLNTSVSSPIGRSSISISDLLDMQEISGLGYDENGVIVFTYDTLQRFEVEPIKTDGFNSIRSMSGYDLFEEELTEAGITKEKYKTLNIPYKLPLPANEKINICGKIAVSDLISEDQYRIDSIVFKHAPVVISLNTDIPGLLENSTATIGLATSENEAGKTTTANASRPFLLNLSNSVIKLGKADSIELTGYLTLSKKMDVTLTSNSYLSIRLTAESDTWTFDKAWGIFNGIEPQYGFENIPIDLYEKNNEDGVIFNLLVENPQITLKARTNMGVPFLIGISRLEASNDKKTIAAEFDGGNKTFLKELNYAKTPGDDITALDVSFDKNNGSIDKLVNMLPNQVNLEYTFAPVEADLNGDKNYFITSDAYIDLLCRVELPAYLRKGSYILVTDTLKDIEIGEDLGEKYSFDKIKLTAIASNSLPFNAKVQFYFMQENEETGEMSIIPDVNINKDITVSAGKVDPKTDIVKSATTTIDLLEFREKDIPSLKKAKHLLIMYEVAVNDFDKVKVTKDNKLNIVLKAFAKGSVNIGKLEDKDEDENN